MAVNDLCHRHGFSEASYYLWRSTFGGMSVPGDPVINALTIVDDGTLEAAAIEVERAISAYGVVRVLNWQQVIRTDNGDAFCGRTMVACACERGAQARLIPPGRLNQNACIEIFNAHLRDECLNEHGFPTRLHARSEIETLRREYNEERPKTILGGLTPAAHP